jgi:hypothetical protein
MFILRNNHYRAASLLTGILLLVLVIFCRDLFGLTPADPAAESVHLDEAGVSRAQREDSFFQPIIQLTVKVHEHYAGENDRAAPADEAVLYRRR